MGGRVVGQTMVMPASICCQPNGKRSRDAFVEIGEMIIYYAEDTRRGKPHHMLLPFWPDGLLFLCLDQI